MSSKEAEASNEAATEEEGSDKPQRPNALYKRKLGHAPRSLCLEVGGGVVRGQGHQDQKAHLNPASEACMTPARSVPDMDQMTDSTHVPYQPLNEAKRGLPGQLSSQTASVASEGSQVSKIIQIRT